MSDPEEGWDIDQPETPQGIRRSAQIDTSNQPFPPYDYNTREFYTVPGGSGSYISSAQAERLSLSGGITIVGYRNNLHAGYVLGHNGLIIDYTSPYPLLFDYSGVHWTFALRVALGMFFAPWLVLLSSFKRKRTGF